MSIFFESFSYEKNNISFFIKMSEKDQEIALLRKLHDSQLERIDHIVGELAQAIKTKEEAIKAKDEAERLAAELIAEKERKVSKALKIKFF